ncbi:LOW QUALITY PROTEIN: fer-1-like protein 5 [Falco biarmicus]|uniref:LOW QUALITY PROTEIN: fer-1-like protein 5 n=1 Tax=Falco biarmicus TaxID=345155 RepID=UPI0024BCDB9E|nr:LOW QUALITY PROTEIN: fer-1-like protein 5 [Falco biarmicus]
MLRLLVASAHVPRPTSSGPGLHVSARFRGVPRSTRVVPEEHSPIWNETLVWPLGMCPLQPTASLTLRLRHWGPAGTPGGPRGHHGFTGPVRVRIIKGHQLQGNDIKPVVIVLIGQHRFRTRIRVGNNPYYNEVFCQNFYLTLAQLVVEPIRIQVLDSRATRAKAVIGIFQLPPICDEIQLAILSGSRSSKVLGTAVLHLSQISSRGPLASYPASDPASSPSTVLGRTLPGSSAPDTKVAYRGRVLLELSTHMRTPDGCQQATIAPEDVTRVQCHLPRHRFGLCGVFYSATMVPAGPELLRFELSLGNYGDMGDVTCKPAASVTPHGCPLFDGNRYHYLPWYGDKPVAAVTSSWEDASHRWDALNLLHALCRRLERNVAELRGARGDMVGDIGRRLLRQLAQDCGRALPRLEAQPTPTPLDTHLRATRLHVLRCMAAAAAVPPRAGWDTLLPVAEGWLGRVTALAVEPQAGVPDVLLWLLRGERRVACARVPAADIMFSRSGPGACGQLCGRIQTLFLVGSGDICAQLRLRLWLGRVADSKDLPRHLEGTLHVYVEMYENQTKLLGKWGSRGLLGRPSFSDSAGKAGLPCHRIQPPKGWRWKGPWTVEPQRRLLLDTETNMGEVLEDVYENESRQPSGEWGPAAVASTDAHSTEAAGAEAWEYGSLWGRRFHLQPRTGDVCRRRCWHRGMVPTQPPPVAPLFLLEGSLGMEDLAEEDKPAVAEQQAQDPVAHVSFVHVSQSTQVLPGTRDPLWDQTLIFHRVLLYGDPRGVWDEPPTVVVEVFDQDKAMFGWMWGTGSPPGSGVTHCRDRGGPAGELLAAFELLGVRAPSLEVQCGGQTLRTPTITDLAANPNFPINAFLLMLHLPAEEEYVPPIRLRVLDMRDFGYRPEVGQACVRGLGQYCCQPHGKGQPPSSGTPQTSSGGLLPGSAAPWGRIAQLLPRITAKIGAEGKAAEEKKEADEDEGEEDWWSKFYTAMGDKTKSRQGTSGDRLKIYSCELEAVPDFGGLQDFCQTFPLYQPGGHPEAREDPVPVGEFKGLFCIYPLPEDPEVPPPPRHFQQLPPSQPQKCLVRVYIIRAFDLPPPRQERAGKCDPYIRVSLGTKTLGQRDQYVPNTLEPVFGRLFELTGTIPLEKDLRVTLLDYDLLPPDQEIGTTTIDLENRLLSRFRAHCGLPTVYRTTGPGYWRDQLPPSQTLEHFARTRGMPAPEFSAEGTTVTFGDHTFLLSQFESGPSASRQPEAPRERLALHVLHACHLVPEHLETRTLYNSTQPGLEQGKVQMWVDIFPASLGPPGPPVDITPRKPQRYELRCVVWNTRDVDLKDINLLGQRMSDIYVTGWLDGLEEQRQKTDVHYRSLQGDGSFNWRFVFPFEYLVAEQLCVLLRKEHFWSLDETVLKVPPKLILQVWDNDKFSADDFLGVLELELTRLPQPAQRPQDCTPMAQETPQSPWPWRRVQTPSWFSLFRQRRARGWWPCTVQEGGKRRLSGKVELSLELLTAKEAEERPVGKGRDDPNMYPTLPAPARPEWSFLWLQAPLRSLRYSICQQHRCRISLTLALLLLFALLLTFVYATPGYLAMKLVNPLQNLHLAGSEHQAAGHHAASVAKP